jgi:hypothetical protein
VKLSEDLRNKNLILKLVVAMSNNMFGEEHIEKITQIVDNLLKQMDTKELVEFNQNILDKRKILEVYKQNVPPILYIFRLSNYSLQELCEAISNTKLNEKHHKHIFDYLDFPYIVERYLDEKDLQICLKNVTVAFRKIIVNQIVERYKKFTKQILLKFNNIYPIIVKKIYSNYLTVRFSKLIVSKIDMKTIILSDDEILDMCLLKEDYECGICYLNQITTICKTCGHGICTSCETGIQKDVCSFCRENYSCVTIRS